MAKKSSSVGKAIKNEGQKMKDHRQALNAEGQSIIARARELAWMGQHAAAIELASQELSRSRLKRDLQMDLLDLRAESYIALGKLDRATKDAQAMMKLARSGGLNGTSRPPTNLQSPVSNLLMAQALNRIALVQMRMGDLKAAVKSATTALKAAQQSKQKPLIAESLFRLSEAQYRTQQSEAALETAQKANALFHELGDLSGAGRAHWVLSLAFYRLNRTEDSRRAAYAALEIC